LSLRWGDGYLVLGELSGDDIYEWVYCLQWQRFQSFIVGTGLDDIVTHGMENDRPCVEMHCTLRASFSYGISITGEYFD